MSDPNCIFCKIVRGEIPATFVHRDDDIAAIEDVNPQAPAHVLVLPVEHVPNLEAFAAAASPERIANLLRVAGRIGRERGENGFRMVVNTGADGGQTVEHLHVHVLAGRGMQWPPG